MTLQDRVLAYLRSIAPQRATNSDIRHNLSVRHHPQIYQETQILLQKGLIQGRRNGSEWKFWVGEAGQMDKADAASEPVARREELTAPVMDSRHFEIVAREVMSKHYGVELVAGNTPNVPKLFDMISADGQVVGDAKYYTLVGGTRLPPAKFSVIAEYVWLLEKTQADHRFLVFGNEIRVPQMWLARYGSLIEKIDFFFLSNNGSLSRIDR